MVVSVLGKDPFIVVNVWAASLVTNVKKVGSIYMLVHNCTNILFVKRTGTIGQVLLNSMIERYHCNIFLYFYLQLVKVHAIPILARMAANVQERAPHTDVNAWVDFQATRAKMVSSYKFHIPKTTMYNS